MSLPLENIPVPIRIDENGVARIGATQVILSVMLAAYLQGDSPALIQESFPTLELADIHAVIAYYLHNREEVDAYLTEHESQGEAIQAKIESSFPSTSLREKLLARRASQTESV